MTETLELSAATADEMRALGARLGACLERGDVVGLRGGLGSGKTTFAQGIAAGLGVPPDRHVASPSFALVIEHPGRIPFSHADLYRIAAATELDELGLGEASDRGALAVEWIDRFPRSAPEDRLEVEIAVEPDEARRLRARAHGPRSAALLGAWRRAASEAG
jgi:tRNA threonylcarbamoyladenosine biosynthesis protein TsaE